MGAFFIARDSIPPQACAKLDEAHRDHGFQPARTIKFNGYSIYQYRKLDGEGGIFWQWGEEHFAALTGQLLYRGLQGAEAQRHYCEDLAGEGLAEDRVIGQFAILLKDARGLRLFTDRMGFFQAYYNAAQGIAASSFWALLELLPKITVDPAGVYEYAWNGATFGGKSFVREIGRLPARTLIELGHDMKLVAFESGQTPAAGGMRHRLDDYAEDHAERARSLFGDLAEAYGNRLRISFSSGYDSRLMLAALKSVGAQPSLFVYGKDGDTDVEVAENVAESEGLELDVIDKTYLGDAPGALSPDRQKRDFVTFDAWKVDGIFDGGEDDPDRRSRHTAGRVPLNGSLGEIYRNFFYLRDRPMALEDVASSFFSAYAPQACSERFSASDYRQTLAKAFQRELATDEPIISRAQVESLYPLVRGRYWTGRDVNLNLRFGRMFFPFMQAQLIEGTDEIPIAFKEYGQLEARIICLLDRRIASIPSGYGFAFSQPPPLRYRAKLWMTLFRPPWLRRKTYRIRFAKPRPFPPYLERDFLEKLMDPSMPYMQRYFNIERLHDPDAFNRVATMEYVFQTYSADE